MPTPTYDLISSTTLVAPTSEVLFGSLPATYRDLIIIGEFVPSGAFYDMGLRFNSDSTYGNYGFVEAAGNGSTTNSNSGSRAQAVMLYTTGTDRWMFTAQIMDYSATNKHKIVLSRANSAAVVTIMSANRWANTAAITSVAVRADASTFAAGSTFAIYGIAS